jgi:hypothetical protein
VAPVKLTRHVELLAALVLMELANPLFAEANTEARIASLAFFGVVCVAVFRALFRTPRRRWIGSILVGIALSIDLAREVLAHSARRELTISLDISVAVFYVFVFSVILRHVFTARHLRIDDVVGAFSGYILIALVWGRLYSLAWMLAPNAFNINSGILWQLNDWNTQVALFDYYSFTTISSIGYAAITTTAPPTNTLVWLEVMCGQFYMAVVVATIVGMKLAEAISAPRGSS